LLSELIIRRFIKLILRIITRNGVKISAIDEKLLETFK